MFINKKKSKNSCTKLYISTNQKGEKNIKREEKASTSFHQNLDIIIIQESSYSWLEALGICVGCAIYAI